jgi:heat-inducible transcriptional repressor
VKTAGETGAGIHELGELPQRLSEVLLAVLRGYVESGHPVGSRDACAQSGLSVSSATVRGAMGELMELGLLEQPHTSAGRVPTDAAFRLWVDTLLHDPHAGSVPRELARELRDPVGVLEDSSRRAADVLTQVTGQLGFCLAVEGQRSRLTALRFVRVSSDRVMALLVSEGDVVRTRLLDERECDQRKLDRISSALSRLVAGLTLEEARARLSAEIEGDRAQRDALWGKLVALGRLGLEVEVEAELYVGDRTRMLEQPEFEDNQRLRELLRALDEKQRMLALLDNVLTAGSLRVVIGDELGDPGVARCAVVAESVGGAAHRGGAGVIGPVRMRYDRVIPVVRYVSGKLGSALA